MTGLVVIVGGGGFLGTALARSLIMRKTPVRVLDRPHRLERSAKLLAGVEKSVFEFPDTLGIERHLQGATALIHLTCTSTPSSSMHSLRRDADENIAPSVTLFETAGAAGVQKVLFASSGGTVYGNSDRFPIVEDTPLAPLSGYGASKVAIETYLQLAARRDGFCGVNMRIANPYGPYQLSGAPIGNIARYLSLIAQGEPLTVWGDGGIVRDYIHIGDTIAAILALLDQKDLPSGAYNIGSGTGVSINEIIATLSEITKAQPQVDLAPARGFDVRRIVLDTDKITKATGWAPETSLYHGTSELWDTLQSWPKLR